MDDISTRLGAVEAGVTDVRRDVADVRKEVADVRREVADVRKEVVDVRKELVQVREKVAEMSGEMRHVATKADMKDMENRLIKWILGAMLAGMGLAVGIAQIAARFFGHP